VEKDKETAKCEAALELLELSVRQAGFLRRLREPEERLGIAAEEIHDEAKRLFDNHDLIPR